MPTAPGTEPQSFVRLGEMTKVERTAADQLTFTFSPYIGMCCPHIAELHLAPDGNLQGNFVAGPNQLATPTSWRRVESFGTEK